MIKKINFINSGGKTIVVTFLLTILLVSFISAFGVATSYWKGNPLEISPGETAVVNLQLQNMVGDEDITLKAVLTQGSEIASVQERDYLVKAGTRDTNVPVTVTIPLNESPGMEYVVTVSFKTVNNEGGIALGTGIDSSFDVLVAGILEEEEPTVNYLFIVLALVFIIAILIIIYIFRKKIFGKKK